MTKIHGNSRIYYSYTSYVKFHSHIIKFLEKFSSCIFALRKLFHCANSDVMLTLYYRCFYPHLIYAFLIWGFKNFSALEKGSPHCFMLKEMNLVSHYYIRRKLSHFQAVMYFRLYYLKKTYPYIQMTEQFLNIPSGQVQTFQFRNTTNQNRGSIG